MSTVQPSSGEAEPTAGSPSNPRKSPWRPTRKRLLLLIPAIALAAWAVCGGYVLVKNNPAQSDAIVVLAGGDDSRAALGLDLAKHGWGRRVIIDIVADEYIFSTPILDIGKRYVDSLPSDLKPLVSICPIYAHSTKGETRGAAKCLEAIGARSVLLVTSNYHTRRTLSVFRSDLPQFQFTIAGVRDSLAFDPRWWTSRESAKIFVLETTRLGWYELVDRWLP